MSADILHILNNPKLCLTCRYISSVKLVKAHLFRFFVYVQTSSRWFPQNVTLQHDDRDVASETKISLNGERPVDKYVEIRDE